MRNRFYIGILSVMVALLGATMLLVGNVSAQEAKLPPAPTPDPIRYENTNSCAEVQRTGGEQAKRYSPDWMLFPNNWAFGWEPLRLYWGTSDNRGINPENYTVIRMWVCVKDEPYVGNSRTQVLNRTVEPPEYLVNQLWKYVFRGKKSGGMMGDPIDPVQEYWFSQLVQETYKQLGLDPPRALPMPLELRELLEEPTSTPTETVTPTPGPPTETVTPTPGPPTETPEPPTSTTEQPTEQPAVIPDNDSPNPQPTDWFAGLTEFFGDLSEAFSLICGTAIVGGVFFIVYYNRRTKTT